MTTCEPPTEAREVQMMRGCFSCLHWSEDDDGDGHGSCAVLLNDPAAQSWRTLPGYICAQWRYVAPIPMPEMKG